MKDKDVTVDRDAPRWTPEMFARSVVKQGLKTTAAKSLLSLRVDSASCPGSGLRGRAISRV